MALKEELALCPVLIEVQGKESHWLDDTMCEWFMAHITEAQEIDPDTLVFDQAQLEDAVEESEEYMAQVRKKAEGELLRRNDTLIDNRIESMRQAAQVKIQKVRDILGKLRADGRPEDDSIVRLHRGRIANLEQRLDAAIQKLEDKRQVLVTFSLVLGGVVQLES